jgi:O-antigen/teichoic acid export membrane protein
VPLFMFQAVQAALLPRLARLAAQGDFDEFRAGFRRLIVLVVAVGTAGTAGAFLIGRPVLKLVFDSELSGRTLAMLALSSAIYMAGLATAQAVVALRGHHWVAVGWGLGFVTFVVTTWLAGDQLFRRIEIGLVASSVSALVVFALVLKARLRKGAAALTGPVGPFPELPLEA